jgi:hypothetical protein
MLRALSTAGTRINWRTLTKLLARTAPAAGAPVPPDAALAAEVAAAVDGTDLGRLEHHRNALDAALRAWEPILGVSGPAVRAYGPLLRWHGEVTARLVELRPRPEAEVERLAALGTERRDELYRRAVAAATADELAERDATIADLRRTVGTLLDAIADTGEVA